MHRDYGRLLQDAYSLEDSDGYTRYNFNAIVSEYGLADTFFPAFKRAVIDGNAQGIMCSYNAVNGQPTCANDYLRHALREVWNFTGYITSDSGALEDIYQQHKYVQTEAEAACVAIRNGSCDVCSGAVYHDALLEGVQQGLCTMDNVNAALSRTLAMRMRLGLFDPAENQPYWHVPLSAVNTTASQALNLLATQSSMVLLKNDKTLPLKKGIKLAVIGPFANTQEALVGNYLGQLCADNSLSCVTTPFQAFSNFNVGGTTQMVNGCNITTNYTNGFQQAVALAKQSDAVVLVMGIDGTIEGESHDRTSIDLPTVQHQLAAAIAALNIPTVLILINGGMVDITPEKASIPAIIEAGYPGTVRNQPDLRTTCSSRLC
jgi:beta-D-xylosidase 4